MLAAIRQWVIKTMMKGQTGVVRTLPKQEIIEMNVQITAERIMRNGINPNDLKTVGQVENVVNQIDAPKVVSADSSEGKGITEQLLGKKKAPVFDMEGNKIPEGSKIMGGKEVKPIDKLKNYTKSDEEIVQDLVDQKFGKGYFDNVDGSETAIKDAAIKARLEADNKKGLESIREKQYQDAVKKEQAKADADPDYIMKIIDPEDFATGGRVGLKGGAFLNFIKNMTMNKKSPLQFGKDYLKNVKEKTLKANETGKFMDLPIAEVGIPAASGALVNNQIRKKLKNMNEDQKEENLKMFIRELENDKFYDKYPDIKDEMIADYTERLFGEKRANGGRIGYAGGSDMGTVSGATRSANTGLKGGYQNTGTGPVERSGGGGGNNKPPRVVTRTVTKPDIKDKIRRTGNTIGDISYFKNLIKFNPTGIIKNVGGKILMDKILGDRSSLDTEDEYDFSGIKGQMAGLNQEQVDFLDKIGKRNQAVGNSDFYTYDTPTSIKNKIEDLNSKSTNFIGTFKPDKIVEGDKNTFATDQDVENYMKDTYQLGTANNKLGLADGGRIGYKAGSVDKMRRLILKAMGAGTAGIAAAKSGIFSGFGKGAGKTVAKEVAQQTTSSMPPPYFFKLAEKIKMLGADATATTDRTIAKSLKSKDGKSEYLLEQDVSTGDTIIKKINKEGDDMITDVEIMELKKGEVVIGKDGKPVKVPDEYEEVTEANARIEGDVFNDPYYTDGIQVDEIIKEVDDKVPSIKYANGGLAYMLGE